MFLSCTLSITRWSTLLKSACRVMSTTPSNLAQNKQWQAKWLASKRTLSEPIVDGYSLANCAKKGMCCSCWAWYALSLPITSTMYCYSRPIMKSMFCEVTEAPAGWTGKGQRQAVWWRQGTSSPVQARDGVRSRLLSSQRKRDTLFSLCDMCSSIPELYLVAPSHEHPMSFVQLSTHSTQCWHWCPT